MTQYLQEHVDDMQAALLAGERVYRPAVRRIAHSALDADNLSPEMRKALTDCWQALRFQMRAFHSLAAACSVNTGVTPQSVDPDKDDDDGGN